MQQKLEAKLRETFPDSQIKLICDQLDGMHVSVTITSARFKNLNLVDQHRLVQAV